MEDTGCEVALNGHYERDHISETEEARKQLTKVAFCLYPCHAKVVSFHSQGVWVTVMRTKDYVVESVLVSRAADIQVTEVSC